ncbi:MAG: hypothetical protein WCL07_03585 [bacterium]
MLSTKEKNKNSTKSASGGTTKIIWEDLYTDLNTPVAQALRDARVKPNKLPIMSDDEIMAIPGISDAGLEEIRSQYTADIKAAEDAKVETAKSSTTNNETEEQIEVVESEEVVGPKPANKRHLFQNGKAISQARAKINRDQTYPIAEAIKLVVDNTIAKFDATITLHINLVGGKEQINRAELTFPHLAGTAKRVVIATDDILKDIEAGKIEFDILITTPAMMPKLAKFAKVLGPKGLMPNPKNGTVTPNPESKKKEFEAGKTVVKAEAKFPLMHITVGKTKQPAEEILANIQAVVEAVKTKNIAKATLVSSMSPGVKLQIS